MESEIIFMPLLNEGTDVWVPVRARVEGVGLFRIIGPMPEDQKWRFPTGTLVRTRVRKFADGKEAVAAYETAD
jgi:hypothetical protein